MPDEPWYPKSQNIQPMRPLDWRWQRAMSLYERDEYYISRRDDPLTGRALRFIRASYGAATPWYRRRLLRGLDDIEGGHAIWGGPSSRRIEIEARILARESAAKIASRFGLPASAVAAFEAVFYDVTDRLDAKEFITLQAIGLPPYETSEPPEPGKLLKLVAFTGGPLALDGFLRYLNFKARIGVEPGPLSAKDRVLFDSIDLFLLAHDFPLDEATTLDLARKWPLVQQISEKLPVPHTLADVFAAETQNIIANLGSATAQDQNFEQAGERNMDRDWEVA